MPLLPAHPGTWCPACQMVTGTEAGNSPNWAERVNGVRAGLGAQRPCWAWPATPCPPQGAWLQRAHPQPGTLKAMLQEEPPVSSAGLRRG